MKNTSDLSDELFFSLSLQGQACAIRSATAQRKRSSSPQIPKLTAPQVALLQRALGSHSYALALSNTRVAWRLVDLGLFEHEGGVASNRPTARFKLTEKGLAAAKAQASTT